MHQPENIVETSVKVSHAVGSSSSSYLSLSNKFAIRYALHSEISRVLYCDVASATSYDGCVGKSTKS